MKGKWKAVSPYGDSENRTPSSQLRLSSLLRIEKLLNLFQLVAMGCCLFDLGLLCSYTETMLSMKKAKVRTCERLASIRPCIRIWNLWHPCPPSSIQVKALLSPSIDRRWFVVSAGSFHHPRRSAGAYSQGLIQWESRIISACLQVVSL